MKNLKLAFVFLFLFSVLGSVSAQSKATIPENLHGFWNFDVDTKGNWDGTLIGAEYVEYFYQLYAVEAIEITDSKTYKIDLSNENGATLKLIISEIGDKKAKLKFSEWDAPKDCKLLDIPTDTEPVTFETLPTALFQEWTTGDGELACLFHDKNQLFYKGHEWEILQAGYYLNREYRMLIKSGNQFKYIFLNNITDKSLRLVCNLQQELFIPLAKNREIYKILGNWIEQNSNTWSLGFFEELAIYNGDFWTYKSFETENSNFKIVLENEWNKVDLEINIIDKKRCEIKIDGSKKISYFKCDKYLPAYSIPDSSTFLDTNFKKLDTAIIRGYLRNIPLEKPFSASFNDPIKVDQVEFYADVDDLGRFTLKVPLLNTTQVYLDWGRMTKIDVLEPGEEYLLFYDFSNGQHLNMGDNARLHNELATYEIFYANRGMSREDYQKIQDMEQMDYLRMKKDELAKSDDHLNNYIAENPLVSEKFKYYQKNNYRFRMASDLLQRRFKLDRNAKQEFPEGFMEYVNDTLYKNNPVQPFTLVREYLSFMRDYTGYKQEQSSEVSISISSFEAFGYMEKEGKIEFSKEERNSIKMAKEFFSLISKLRDEKADSVQISEASKPYMDNQKKILELFQREEVNAFLQNEWKEIVSVIFAKKRMESAFVTYDSIISDPILKDVFEAQKFYWYIDYKKSELPDDLYQWFKERITNPALVAQIEQANNFYLDISKQDILYVESLKNTDHLKDAKDADLLFAQLTEPYRGKVVYIDFWGTWCGPCKQQMKYVGEVKKALKDEDVIFMYFANNSPEASWKNVIKENHLSGENAVHYRLPPEQQKMLERRLSIRAFPTYILMDKKGNIVNMKAPRPQEKGKLVGEIKKLL